MPVFNHRDEVRTMIDSILANDFNAWELLAVDDGIQIIFLSLYQCFLDCLRIWRNIF